MVQSKARKVYTLPASGFVAEIALESTGSAVIKRMGRKQSGIAYPQLRVIENATSAQL